MPIASTSTGILPTAWLASVWKRMPFSLASRPTDVTSWMVPISLLANITEIRMVLSVSALRIASVPPEVKTSSFGSRAPISVAILPRAASTAPSASHPNGWLRLAGCPNFSVKYGSIASTTRGSHGVVDCASMKIGNFSPIPVTLSGFDRQQLGYVGARQLGQAHRVQHLADGRLDLVDGPPEIALFYLRALRVLQARHDVDRSLQRPDHLPDRDLRRPARQRIAALGPVGTDDQPLLGEPLEDLGHELRRDRELLGNPLGTHRTEAVVDGDIMNRHQPVIGALGESEHSVTRPCLSISLYRR